VAPTEPWPVLQEACRARLCMGKLQDEIAYCASLCGEPGASPHKQNVFVLVGCRLCT
jgi:hypothetical protein